MKNRTQNCPLQAVFVNLPLCTRIYTKVLRYKYPQITAGVCQAVASLTDTSYHIHYPFATDTSTSARLFKDSFVDIDTMEKRTTEYT